MNKEYLRAMAVAENVLVQIKCIYEKGVRQMNKKVGPTSKLNEEYFN